MSILTYILGLPEDECKTLSEAALKLGVWQFKGWNSTQTVEKFWSENPAHMVIVGLQAAHAKEFVVDFRAVAAVPVAVVIENAQEDVQLDLYNSGADLVVVRPYRPRILLAQAQQLIRRSQSLPSSHLPRVSIGRLLVDPQRRTVEHPNQFQVRLTQREFQLFYLLYLHKGQVLTVDQIIEAVWGYTGQGDEQMLRSLIYRLRRKLQFNTEDSEYIQNLSGVGYMFLEED